MSTIAQEVAGTFVADPAHSTFRFSVKHMSVSTFTATFDDVDMRVVGDDEGVRFDGTARVESVSIRAPQEFREHVVYGADFFDAHNHPEISFRSDDVDLAEDGTATLRGELTIRGITRPFTATGTHQPLVEDPWGSIRGGFDFEAAVDRRDWGLDWQAPLPAGGDALGYDVVIGAHVELVRQG